MTAMKMNMMAFLTRNFGCSEFPESEVERNIGILRTNGMKLEQGEDCPPFSSFLGAERLTQIDTILLLPLEWIIGL